MGMTIHYHGKIADLARIEEFEDRVVDMALEIGAAVRIWRNSPDADPTRVVRGLLLDVAPGQETTSLLIWDASYKEQRRKQERLHRAMEEQLRSGADHAEAFENAMRGEGIIDLPGEPDEDDFAPEEAASGFETEPEDESWRASLPPELESDDDPFDVFGRERHPLQQQASDLHLRVFKLFKDAQERQSGHVGTLLTGVGEIGGGLAQALTRCDDELDGLQRGLALVQLKRALRGAAFASGALFPLQADGLLSPEDFKDLQRTLQQLEDGIVGELTRIREQRER